MKHVTSHTHICMTGSPLFPHGCALTSMTAKALHAVSPTLNFVKRPAGGDPVYYYLGGKELPPGIPHFTNFEQLPEQATITDLRSAQQEFSLRQNGFTLAKLVVPAEVDWDDKASVQSLYYPAAEKLLQQETGARIHIFDSTRRKGSIRSASDTARCSWAPSVTFGG